MERLYPLSKVEERASSIMLSLLAILIPASSDHKAFTPYQRYIIYVEFTLVVRCEVVKRLRDQKCHSAQTVEKRSKRTISSAQLAGGISSRLNLHRNQ